MARLTRVLVFAVAAFGLLAGATRHASATEQFTFSYSGGGVQGDGVLEAELIGPGTWLAVSGWDHTTGGPISGTLPLVPNANPPGEVYSQSGFFIYDDLLMPASDPTIDNGGLLFANGAGGEVNLFTYGPDNYTHYDDTGFNVPITFDLNVAVSSNSSTVPEPASIALLGTALLGLRLLRRRPV